jgi:hypothetical protein
MLGASRPRSPARSPPSPSRTRSPGTTRPARIAEDDRGQTATFTTDAVDIGHGGVLCASLTVANVGGTTPTLTSTVQTSADNGVKDPWRPAFVADSAVTSYTEAITGDFPAQTAKGTVRRRFIVDRWVRFVHTIGGTRPSFDITVHGFVRGMA